MAIMQIYHYYGDVYPYYRYCGAMGFNVIFLLIFALYNKLIM